MLRLFLRRLLAIPFVMLLVNLIGFVYATIFGPIQSQRRPPASFGTSRLPPFLSAYLDYLRGFTRLDFGTLPNGDPIADAIGHTMAASAGLLVAAFVLSIVIGLILGWSGVHTDPPVVARWLTVLFTFGQSSPVFYIGSLFIAASVAYLLWGPGEKLLLPFQGFGWDAHMILPVLALMVRPTFQIAHTTAHLLSEELGKQYVVVLRGMGHSRRAIRSRFAFRNILALVILAIAGSWRLLIVELIILERLFSWPGLGKLISSTLVLSSQSDNFLFPPLVAGLLSALAFLFMTADLIAVLATRLVDPRLTTS
jgi:peptide/nickel transport system permease protein